MRVVVLGAGAIGTLYGVKLSVQNEVILLAREEHADKIARGGVRVTGLEEATYRVRSSTHLSAIETNTLVLLTTKAYDSEAAIRPIAEMLQPDTIILCLQNGLYAEDVVRRIVGDRCLVLRGITYFGAIFAEPGVVALKAHGFTSIENSPQSRQLADMFSRSGLDGRVSERIRDEMWMKVIFNCVVNPLTAMTGMEVGWITDERLDPLKRRIIEECIAVTRRDGVVFGIDVFKAVNDTFRPSRNLSSMHQDLLKGKRTEIDYLNAAVVQLGVKYGIDCPVNRALAAIIKEMEKDARRPLAAPKVL